MNLKFQTYTVIKRNPTDGREIELTTSPTHVVWRYVGDATWIELIDLLLLKGQSGDDGNDGREVELSTSNGFVVWRYVGDFDWIDICPIPVDGREVELSATTTHIVWRYVGDTNWIELVPLDDLKGADGVSAGQVYYFHHPSAESPAGFEGFERIPADSGEDVEYADVTNGEVLLDKYITKVNDPGTSVIKAGLWYFDMHHYVNSSVGTTKFRYEVWKYESDTTETKLFEVLTSEINNTVAAEIETTYIQTDDIPLNTNDRIFVKVYATATHTNAIRCYFIYEGVTRASHVHTPIGVQGVVGEDGRELELSANSTHIIWRYVGDLNWIDLVELSTLKGDAGNDGDNGREVEMRENAGWVQWRYVGDVSWIQLYEIPSAPADTAVKVAIDFVDAAALTFVYNCPVALVFTSQDSEGDDATISPVLNTNMSQYGKVTVTAPAVGLIVLNGNTL